MHFRPLLVAIILVATAASAALGADWVTYTHPEHGFTIQYPGDWTRLSGDKDVLLIVVGPRSAAGVPLGFIILGAALKPGETVVDDFEEFLARAAPTRLQGYQPLRTDRATIDGRPAVIHYLTYIQNGVRMYAMLAAMAGGRYGYLIIASTSASSPQLREEINLLQRIILTFRPRQ